MQKLLKCLYRDFETLNQTRLVFDREVPGKSPDRQVAQPAEAPEAPEAPATVEEAKEIDRKLRAEYGDEKILKLLDKGATERAQEDFLRLALLQVNGVLYGMWEFGTKTPVLKPGYDDMAKEQLESTLRSQIDHELSALLEKRDQSRDIAAIEAALGVSGEGSLGLIQEPREKVAVAQEEMRLPEGIPKEKEEEWQRLEAQRKEALRRSKDPVEARQTRAEQAKLAKNFKAEQEHLIAVLRVEQKAGTRFDLQIVPNEGEREIRTLVKDHLVSIFFKMLDNPSAATKLEELYITSKGGTKEDWDEMVRTQKPGLLTEEREAAVYQYILARYPELTKFNQYLKKEDRLILCYSSNKDTFYLAGQKGKEPVVLAEAGAADTVPLEEGRQRLAARVHQDEALGTRRGPIEIQGSYSKGFRIAKGGTVHFDGANQGGLSLGEMRRRAEKGEQEVWQQASQLEDRLLLTHDGKSEVAVYDPAKKEYYYASDSKKRVEVASGDQIIALYLTDRYFDKGYRLAEDGTVLFDNKQAELSIKLGDIKTANPSLPDQITLVHKGKEIKGYFNSETGQYYTKLNTKNEKDRIRVYSGDKIVEYKPQFPTDRRTV